MKPLYDTPCMRVMQGIASPPGVGLGKAFLYVHERPVTPHVKIEERRCPMRLSVSKELLPLLPLRLPRWLKRPLVDNSEKIVETHLLMLHDPSLPKQ